MDSKTKANLIKQNDLKILHWNANSIWNKQTELELLLNEHNPDFISLNETKLSEIKAFFVNKNSNYNFIFKSRNQIEANGGGVAILIKKTFSYEEIIFDCDDEILGIKVNIEKFKLSFISYYCAPNKTLNINVLVKIINENKNYILCGDLNSKSISFGCHTNNNNGEQLFKLIAESNIMMLNNKEYTFHRPWQNYKEILDLILVSPSIFNRKTHFEIDYTEGLRSDHFPVISAFNINNKSNDKTNNMFITYKDYKTQTGLIIRPI